MARSRHIQGENRVLPHACPVANHRTMMMGIGMPISQSNNERIFAAFLQIWRQENGVYAV
jgi:hypothetical protein